MPFPRRQLLTTAGLTALTAFLAACTSSPQTPQTQNHTSTASAKPQPAGRIQDQGYQLNSRVEGAPTATLYTDFQCPYCKAVDPAVHEAAALLDGTMNVTVKNFPLPGHAYALPAAYAVMAAEAQGKRHEYSTTLFDQQENWSQAEDIPAVLETLTGYAQDLGLDTDRFTTDLRKEELHRIVSTEFQDAIDLGAQGTPTFAVNGTISQDLDASSTAQEIVAEFKRLANLT